MVREMDLLTYYKLQLKEKEEVIRQQRETLDEMDREIRGLRKEENIPSQKNYNDEEDFPISRQAEANLQFSDLIWHLSKLTSDHSEWLKKLDGDIDELNRRTVNLERKLEDDQK